MYTVVTKHTKLGRWLKSYADAVHIAQRWRERGHLNVRVIDDSQRTVFVGRDARASHFTAHLPRPLRARISRKIRLLRHEGYEPKQAAAIAYSMILRGTRYERKRSRR